MLYAILLTFKSKQSLNLNTVHLLKDKQYGDSNHDLLMSA
jgi:hypothetical protein